MYSHGSDQWLFVMRRSKKSKHVTQKPCLAWPLRTQRIFADGWCWRGKVKLRKQVIGTYSEHWRSTPSTQQLPEIYSSWCTLKMWRDVIEELQLHVARKTLYLSLLSPRSIRLQTYRERVQRLHWSSSHKVSRRSNEREARDCMVRITVNMLRYDAI